MSGGGALRALFAVAVMGCLALTQASAQQALTQVEGRFECPNLTNQQECAIVWEKRFMAAHPGLVAKAGHLLKIRLAGGRFFTIDDSDEASNVIELEGDGRFLAIRRQHYEGNTWDLLDLRGGVLTEICGYPLFSPDRTRFVAASEDLEAGYSDTVFDVYDVNPHGVALGFEAMADKRKSTWAARNVRWQDNATIAFTAATPDGSGLLERPAKLIRRHGRWSIVRTK